MKRPKNLINLLKRLTILSHFRCAWLSAWTGSAETFMRLLTKTALPVQADNAYHIFG